jgi:hypothetical protein
LTACGAEKEDLDSLIRIWNENTALEFIYLSTVITNISHHKQIEYQYCKERCSEIP